MANFTNQLVEVNKTLERMDSQLQVSKTINNALENRIFSLEKQYWKNEEYSWRECVEIVEIPDPSNETKVCELIEKFTDIYVTQDYLELSYQLPSDKKKSNLNSHNERMLKVSYKTKTKAKTLFLKFQISSIILTSFR